MKITRLVYKKILVEETTPLGPNTIIQERPVKATKPQLCEYCLKHIDDPTATLVFDPDDAMMYILHNDCKEKAVTE
jgi:hypothetical protein